MNEINEEDYSGRGVEPSPRSVIWTMEYQDGEKEEIFEEELALATLLMSEEIFLNSHWWEKGWPKKARDSISINANCNDVFAWGCSDAETVLHEDLRSVYEHYIKDPEYGVAVWCIKRRKELPQRPVLERIMSMGIWDLNVIKEEFELRVNYYDGISKLLADNKYCAYSEWSSSIDITPIPRDSREWWNGWKEYMAANPDWLSSSWKENEDKLIENWKIENGWLSVKADEEG
jgi:hypothetical protein